MEAMKSVFGMLRKRPVLALLLGALVAAAIVLSVLRVESASTVEQPGDGVATTTGASEPAVGEDEGQRTDSDGVDSPSDPSLVMYTTASAAELLFVDEAGVAQSFSAAPLAIELTPTINRGAEVCASELIGSFGHDDRGFYQLAASYMEDLKADVQACRDGVTSFSSELSLVVDPDQYLAFVSQLAALDDELLSRALVHLVVEADALEAEAEDAAGSSDAEHTSGGASAPASGSEDEDELYGGRPSAGAMD